MKRTFCLVLWSALSLPGLAAEANDTPSVKDGIYTACFRMNIEAKNTYKRIVANDKRSLSISEDHSAGLLSVEEALSEAELILKQQRLAYEHLANVLTISGQLGCPDTARHLGEVEMQ